MCVSGRVKREIQTFRTENLLCVFYYHMFARTYDHQLTYSCGFELLHVHDTQRTHWRRVENFVFRFFFSTFYLHSSHTSYAQSSLRRAFHSKINYDFFLTVFFCRPKWSYTRRSPFAFYCQAKTKKSETCSLSDPCYFVVKSDVPIVPTMQSG